MSEKTTQPAPERVTVTDEELAGLLAREYQWAGTPDVGAPMEVRLARELRALRAPVDVGETLQELVTAFDRRAGLAPPSREAAIVELLARPHVEHAARLQREAEGLRAEIAEAKSLIASIREHRNRLSKACEDEHDAAEDARAEIELLEKELKKTQEAMHEWAGSDAWHRAEIERLKGELAARSEEITRLEALVADKALGRMLFGVKRP